MKHNFRVELREKTRSDHQLLDRLLSDLDISNRQDFATFLKIHLICYSAMARAATPATPAHDELLRMVGQIVSDLKLLGVGENCTAAGRLEKIDPLALDYLIEGSRMGTSILRTRWQTTSDPLVARASSYFSAPTAPQRWKDVRAKLSQIPQNSVRAQTITDDAIKIFRLFFQVSRDLCVQKIQKGLSSQ